VESSFINSLKKIVMEVLKKSIDYNSFTKYAKVVLKISLLVIIACIAITSCTKQVSTANNEISQAVKNQIHELGFNTNDIQKTDEGYLVEGDIELTQAELNEKPGSPLLRIAEVEQYNTFNLVTGGAHTITVSSTGHISAELSNAIDAAIARYNNQNLILSFQRVASGGAINVKLVNNGSFIASSGFPSGGNPFPQIKFNKKFQNNSAGFLTTVIAHEMGHCIGFRHTDYFNRAFSCGVGGNEGQETTGVGAVHIPGTPTGPDAASWMLACLSATDDRPFNANDVIALNFLY
jgi:predicted SprT family Zn-dependent metalloprotease